MSADEPNAFSLRDAFDDAPGAVLAFSEEDWRYVYANDAAAALFGLEPEQLVGRQVGDFTPPDSRAYLAGLVKALEAGSDIEGEHEIVTDDGTPGQISFATRANYRPGIHLSIIRPSDARVAPTLEVFRAAFEHAPDAILLADDERHCLAGNRAARALLGVSRTALLKQRIDDFTPADQRAELDAAWKTLLEVGELEGRLGILGAAGPRTMAFHSRAHVLPGRHLAVLRHVDEHEPASLREALALAGPPVLSPREREVLTHLAEGLDAEAVARALQVSRETVRTHVRNGMRKLGAKTRGEAIALGLVRNEIDISPVRPPSPEA